MARILLVEDNELNSDMLTRRLTRKGYEIVLAVDGLKACEKAEADPPDLILMDMGLPVMDGYEASGRLKASEATRGIPIIALTAQAMVGDRERALAAGCDDYEEKPIDLPRLIGKIEAMLASRERTP